MDLESGIETSQSEPSTQSAPQNTGEKSEVVQAERVRSNASISTRLILQNFDKVVSLGSVDLDASIKIKDLRRRRAERRETSRETIKALKAHKHLTQTPFVNLRNRLSIGRHKFKFAPSHQDALDACEDYFPSRGNIPVRVCDFGEGKGNSFLTTLGKLDTFWSRKPDWVKVRWMHVPIGRGLLHSTIQDLYMASGECGRSFRHAGSSDWPYPRMETFSLQSKAGYQEKLEALDILSNAKFVESDIGKKTFENLDDALQSDLEWRAMHLRTKLSFWDMVKSDFPGLLSEQISLGQQGPLDAQKQRDTILSEQALTDHSQYAEALLTVNSLRSYHKSDGYLLTLSGSPGIDYLDQRFAEYLDEQTESISENVEASVFGHVAEAFLETGTDTWHRKTVEWFMVYLLSEISVTPHNIRQGRSAISILNAYKEIGHMLKQKRKDPWKRNETVNTVRKYLDCIDELRAIKSVTANKLATMEKLLVDCQEMEEEDQKNHCDVNHEGESAIERVEWAVAMLEGEHRDCTKLLELFHTGLDELFQLRSIEQNELAIVADSQNKAILLFTVVTVIFLPLSFFTSYFGMNLQGIADTKKTEVFFWKTCGTVGFILVAILGVYAFRLNIIYWLRQGLEAGKARRSAGKR